VIADDQVCFVQLITNLVHRINRVNITFCTTFLSSHSKIALAAEY